MMSLRWRVRTLAGLVLVAALGIKGAPWLRSRPEAISGPFSPLARLVYPPRPVNAESTLVAAMGDPDAGVRHTAIWALDQIGSTSPVLVRALVGVLESTTERSHWENRRDPEQVYPPWALRRIKPPAAVIAPMLRKAMASQDRWVRSQATEVLCEVAGRPGPPSPNLAALLLAALRDEEAAIRMLAPEALARLDGDTRRRSVVMLLGQLRGPDRPAQLLAAIGLARFDPEGGEAVAILADRLQGGDVATRLADLYLIGRLGPVARTAVPPVVRAMTSRDARQHVFFPLNCFLPGQGSWRSIEVGRVLDSGECSQTSSLCPLGAAVLGRIGPEADRQAVEILAGMLRVEDDSRRLGAVDALGALGPKASAVIPTLIELAERGTSTGAWVADPASLRLLGALEKVCKGDDPRLVAALVRMMESSVRQKRGGVAMTLGHLDPPALLAIPVLIGAMKDRTQAVRFSAADALGRYEGPEWEAAVPALLDSLEDEDDWVRIRAAKALASHRAGAARAVPTVVRLLRSGNPNMRCEAAKVLGAFGPAAGLAVPVLLEVRHDPDGFVRDSAEEALKAVEPSGAANPVE